MKRGHVKGTRKVSRKAQAWYDVIQAEHVKRIEAEWQAKQEQADSGKK
jgi:hypothetical protein